MQHCNYVHACTMYILCVVLCVCRFEPLYTLVAQLVECRASWVRIQDSSSFFLGLYSLCLNPGQLFFFPWVEFALPIYLIVTHIMLQQEEIIGICVRKDPCQASFASSSDCGG